MKGEFKYDTWYFPPMADFETEGLTAKEIVLYGAIKAFKKGCAVGTRELARRCGLSIGGLIRTKVALIELGKIEILGTRQTLGGRVEILKIKRSTMEHLDTTKEVKRSTMEHLEGESVPKWGIKRSTMEHKNKRIKKENKETNKTINEDDSTDIFEKIENFTGLNRLGGKS